MAYAVVWSENGGRPRPGRLELRAGSLLLGGLRLLYDDLEDVRVERRPAARLAGRPTLVLESRVGHRYRVASLAGAGTLHELAERLGGVRRPA